MGKQKSTVMPPVRVPITMLPPPIAPIAPIVIAPITIIEEPIEEAIEEAIEEPIEEPIEEEPIEDSSSIVAAVVEVIPIQIPIATIMHVIVKKPAYKFGDKNPVVVKPIDENAPIIIPVVRPTQPINNNKQPPVKQPPAKTVVEEQTEIIPSTPMKKAEPLTKTKDIETSTSSDSSTSDNTPLIVGGVILSILILMKARQ